MRLATATQIGAASNAPADHFNLSTPAGWAMIYWTLAVIVIGFLFYSA